MKRRITKLFADLPGADSWRFRWLVVGDWNRLHRVTSGKVEDSKFVGVKKGRSLCGLTGSFRMPGILSRMYLQRCAHCCRVAGIPVGDGAPFNNTGKKLTKKQQEA